MKAQRHNLQVIYGPQHATNNQSQGAAKLTQMTPQTHMTPQAQIKSHLNASVRPTTSVISSQSNLNNAAKVHALHKRLSTANGNRTPAQKLARPQ
jgi:hypothetical protein